MMRIDVRKIALAAGLGMVILIAGNSEVKAQSRRDIERERQRIERENARYQREVRRRNSDRRNSAVTNARTEQRVMNANYISGYQQGILAGESDRRKGKYNRSNVYRDTGSYPNEGDPTSYDYMYRQGYLQGYNDGFNGIRNY